jgi:hypothetical protein
MGAGGTSLQKINGFGLGISLTIFREKGMMVTRKLCLREGDCLETIFEIPLFPAGVHCVLGAVRLRVV